MNTTTLIFLIWSLNHNTVVLTVSVYSTLYYIGFKQAMALSEVGWECLTPSRILYGVKDTKTTRTCVIPHSLLYYTGKSKIISHLLWSLLLGRKWNVICIHNFLTLHNYITFAILILVTTVSENDNFEETRSVCIVCIPSFLSLSV